MNFTLIRNAIVLMRIPFSLYLMPVFWFALSCSYGIDLFTVLSVFCIIHLLVYPASNGYNSYCDRDEGSVGGIKSPPPVTKELFYMVLLFDAAAVTCSFLISLPFGICITVYLLVSKAYSYRGIRLKKYAIAGTLVIFIFQGTFTFIMVQAGGGMKGDYIFSIRNLLYSSVSSFFLLGSYPITQIYQHTQDAKNGDKTLSRLLGIKGTFLFSGIVFGFATALLCYLYYSGNKIENILVYLIAMIPVLFFFTLWMLKANKNESEINFENTMRMNKISSLSLSTAFIFILLIS